MRYIVAGVFCILASAASAEMLVQKMALTLGRVGSIDNVASFSCINKPSCMVCMEVDEDSMRYLTTKDESEVDVTVQVDRLLFSISGGNIVSVDGKNIKILKPVCGSKNDCKLGFICDE